MFRTLTTAAVSALIAAVPAHAVQVITLGAAAPTGAKSVGTEARLRYSTTGWDMMLTTAGGIGATSNLSNSAPALYNNSYDFTLSFNAANKTFSWSVTDETFGTRTLTRVETDPFNALRVDFRTTQSAFAIKWDNLSFASAATSGSLQTAGSVSGATRSQWIGGAGSGALSQQNWSFSGRVLATGGNNDVTRMSINAFQVSAIPEPGTAGMLMAGVLAVAGLARRRGLTKR